MRKEEERRLQEASAHIASLKSSSPTIRGFFDSLSSSPFLSLQGAFIDGDFAFFEEASHILSIIETICHKPHVVSKNVETILRADQAGSLSNDSFAKTLRDPALWKNKAGRMEPEYVHHKENEDDILIYENLFIVMALRRIEKELRHRKAFYENRIHLVNSTRLSLDSDRTYEALCAFPRLFSKIERIQKSDFYRIVSKANCNLPRIYPTNILKSDRLYHRVYRFYLEISQYGRNQSATEDLGTYFYCYILKLLLNAGYALSPKSSRVSMDPKSDFLTHSKDIRLISADFLLVINRVDFDALRFELTPLGKEDHPTAKYLLLFTASDSLEGFSLGKYAGETSAYDEIDVLSIWDTAILGRKKYLPLHQEDGEEALLKRLFQGKGELKEASIPLYSLYCPVCGEKGMLEEGYVKECPHCHSKYAFIQNKKKQTRLWVISQKEEEE